MKRLLAASVRAETQAEDAIRAANVLADLSYTTYLAGQTDFLEGEGLVALSGEIDEVSQALRDLGVDAVRYGMELAGMSGQLNAISDLLEDLGLDTMATFTQAMGIRLKDIAVGQIFRARSTRALAASIHATGEEVAALGVNEMGEGVTRMEVSEQIASSSAELSMTGVEKMTASRVDAEQAVKSSQLADALAKQAVAQVSRGAEELGEARQLAKDLDDVVGK